MIRSAVPSAACLLSVCFPFVPVGKHVRVRSTSRRQPHISFFILSSSSVLLTATANHPITAGLLLPARIKLSALRFRWFWLLRICFDSDFFRGSSETKISRYLIEIDGNNNSFTSTPRYQSKEQSKTTTHCLGYCLLLCSDCLFPSSSFRSRSAMAYHLTSLAQSTEPISYLIL